MHKFFIWVMLCWNQDCACEQITYGTTRRQLYISSSKGEFLLEGASQIADTKYYRMRRDTSEFLVSGETANGLVLFINHVSKTKKIDYSIVVSTKRECFDQHQPTLDLNDYENK
jgi:hypothetical protein